MNTPSSVCHIGNDLENSEHQRNEPSWNPQKWLVNSKYNNCYSYALNDHSPSRIQKAIPGNSNSSSDIYTCSFLMEGLKRDHPEMFISEYDQPCGRGFHKIYAATSGTDEDGLNDFHFWRQDSDGLWSHKPGSDYPLRHDGNNRIIQNPDFSNRTFGDRSYITPCGFFCVKT